MESKHQTRDLEPERMYLSPNRSCPWASGDGEDYQMYKEIHETQEPKTPDAENPCLTLNPKPYKPKP